MDEQEEFLRQKARQCRDMARYHSGEAAAALRQMADELEAKADEIAHDAAQPGHKPPRRSQPCRQ
jgi:hypothetical protein